MRFLKFALIITLAFIPLVSCNGDKSAIDLLVIETSNGKKHIFNISVATEKEDLERGLMFVETMPEDEGMLFIYKTDMYLSFWMKNTLIPLDILFIRNDGTIANIHHMAIPHDETHIKSAGGVRAALEINGGLAAKLNIKAGDIIKYDLFQK